MGILRVCVCDELRVFVCFSFSFLFQTLISVRCIVRPKRIVIEKSIFFTVIITTQRQSAKPGALGADFVVFFFLPRAVRVCQRLHSTNVAKHLFHNSSSLPPKQHKTLAKRMCLCHQLSVCYHFLEEKKTKRSEKWFPLKSTHTHTRRAEREED